MNFQKIIIIAIVALLVALLGVGAFSLWLIKSGSAQPAQQEPLGGGEVTDVGASGGTVTAPAASPSTLNLSKEYDSLYATLGAKRISYTLVGSEQGLYGDVYKLYAGDVSTSKKIAPKAAGYTIDVASADLDGDGTPEIIVYENLPGFCGSGGCPIDIYKKHESLYENVFSGLGAEEIGISSKKTGGYSDLLIPVHGDIGFMTNVTSFVWDGSAYVEGAIMATWDGSTFGPPASQ